MSVLSWLLIACWTALASIAGTIHERFLPSPTQPPRARASPGRIHSLQIQAWQSQSFSWSYRSILQTSLSYIVLSNRGCSPTRPAAIMSTNGHENQSFPQVFKGLQEHTGHHKKCGALPTIQSYLLAIRFHGVRSLTKKKDLFPGLLLTFPSSVALPQIWTKRHRIPIFQFKNINLIPFR